jgi:Uma2 family endonuclease
MVTRDVKPARVTWTYADYRGLPDDGNRYEILDGELLVTPAPTITHQKVSKRIQLVLMLQIEQKGLGVVFDAPVDVIFSETWTVQPDLLVVRAERSAIVTERGIEGAPDLVVEIISPKTAITDRQQKQKLYASQGVAEYWLVDPAAHSIEVLELGEEGYTLRGRFGPGDRLESGLFALDLPLDPVFAA